VKPWIKKHMPEFYEEFCFKKGDNMKIIKKVI